jgi:tetratricopeptide (TPR) repeat protein
LTQVVTGDLIAELRPEFARQGGGSAEEQAPAIAAAVEKLARDDDVDLLALAKNPEGIDLADLEAKLTARAEAHEAAGQRERKASAEYWRHIGALAFLHNTQKAMAAYEKAVALDLDETEGWRYLGELQYRLGDLAAAEQSFRQVLALGQSSRDWRAQAIGSLRLEWIARARGDLAAAEKLAEQARQPREYVRRNGQQDAHVRVLAEGARPVAQNGAGGEGCRGRALAQASWLRRRLSRGSTK